MAVRCGPGPHWEQDARRAASVGLLGGRRGLHHLAQLLDEKGAPPELQQREGGAEEEGQPQRAVALSFALRERQLQHRAHVRHVAAPNHVREVERAHEHVREHEEGADRVVERARDGRAFEPCAVLLAAGVEDVCEAERDAGELNDAEEAQRVVRVAALGHGERGEGEAHVVAEHHRVAQCLDDEAGRYVPEQQDGELELREVQPHSILPEDALGGRRGVRAEPARTTDVRRVQRDREIDQLVRGKPRHRMPRPGRRNEAEVGRQGTLPSQHCEPDTHGERRRCPVRELGGYLTE
mmetsp:Transcript_12187/g.30421  ORF Transcript_12187/g.30421 Transcript_12187/m.30421 type:complete len:295 (-) Transcript_12187:102-986(-)